MSAKPLPWPRWLRKHADRLATAVLGPHLDRMQERGDRVPHMGWVVRIGNASYFTGKTEGYGENLISDAEADRLLGLMMRQRSMDAALSVIPAWMMQCRGGGW